MSLKPIGDRVLIEAHEVAEKSTAGLYLPANAKNPNLEGTVLAVGPGRKLADGSVIPMDIKTGDHIVYAKFTGTEVKINGKTLIILQEKDVLAVIGS